jgi:hypothetical protein
MAIADVLGSRVVRPVYLGFFDFKDDPVYGWTGPGILIPTATGDADLDTNVFLPTAGVVSTTDFVEDQGIGGPVTLTFAAGNMGDEEIFLQLVGDRRKFQGRRARFWLAFLEEDESDILPEIENLFSGVMTGAETERQPGKPATISITCDQDLGAPNKPPIRYIDHQVFYPGDTASSHINDLVRGPVAVAQPTIGFYIPRGPRYPR